MPRRMTRAASRAAAAGEGVAAAEGGRRARRAKHTRFADSGSEEGEGGEGDAAVAEAERLLEEEGRHARFAMGDGAEEDSEDVDAEAEAEAEAKAPAPAAPSERRHARFADALEEEADSEGDEVSFGRASERRKSATYLHTPGTHAVRTASLATLDRSIASILFSPAPRLQPLDGNSDSPVHSLATTSKANGIKGTKGSKAGAGEGLAAAAAAAEADLCEKLLSTCTVDEVSGRRHVRFD